MRVYDRKSSAGGRRILIDRLRPRGLSKVAAGVDHWARAVAPSDALRRWYRDEPEKWPEFRRRYVAELDANPAGVAERSAELGAGPVTFVFASRETRLNTAAALVEYLESR